MWSDDSQYPVPEVERSQFNLFLLIIRGFAYKRRCTYIAGVG